MLLDKKSFGLATVILLGSCLLAMAGGRGYPNAGYPYGPDNCVPQRTTYGYYPTNWRRWPTDKRAMATTEPEEIPTPAKEPVPKSGGDLEVPNVPPGKASGEPPSTAPSELPIQPPAGQPTEIPGQPPTSQPSELPPSGTPATPPELPSAPIEDKPKVAEPAGDLPLPLPSEEGPPEPPSSPKAAAPAAKSAAPPLELAPPEDSPEPPTNDVPQSEPPKTKATFPDDDPFQDEPSNENQEPSAKPQKPRSGRSRTERKVGQQEPIRWRVTAKTQSPAGASTPTVIAAANGEPQRLPTVEANRGAVPSALPVNLATSNPLRTASANPRADRVVPTAGWSTEQPSAAAGGSRANPLRSGD